MSSSDSMPPPDDPLIGTVIDGRYRVLRRLGAGGMGAVYVAEHLLTERRLAIKTLLSDYAADTEAVLRFQREARAAARVGNEHIVDVTDMGMLRGNVPYMVLELLEGGTVREALQPGPMPVGRTIHVALQCCSAFGAAHAKGIVHRDIKPDNIFLVSGRRERDFVKVLDFGISKIRHGDSSVESFATSTGIIMGTLHYMSPEQIEGSAAIDHRTDIYALGAVLYEMLCGHPPFQASSIPAFAVQITTAPVPPLELEQPTVPVALARVVERALAKRPEDRFASMEELADAIAPFRAYLEPEGSIVPTGPMSREAAASDRPVDPRARTLDLPAPHAGPTSSGPRASSGYDSGISPSSSTIRRERPERSLGRWLAISGGLVVAALALGAAVSFLGDAEPPAQSSASGIPPSSGPRAATGDPRIAAPDTELIAPAPTPAPSAPRPAAPTPTVSVPSAPIPSQPASPIPEPEPEPEPEPAHTPSAAQPRAASAPTPAPRAAIRRVLVRNERRAETQIAITCSGRTTRASVPAFESRSLRIPEGDCTVRCASSLGLARCPLALPASRSFLEVR